MPHPTVRHVTDFPGADDPSERFGKGLQTPWEGHETLAPPATYNSTGWEIRSQISFQHPSGFSINMS